MLRYLDPYTVYYPEEKNEELKMMTTGKYAGVGSTIRFHKEKNTTVFTGPYENMPALKAGIKAGDAIVSIDGKKTEGLSVSRTLILPFQVFIQRVYIRVAIVYHRCDRVGHHILDYG